MTCCHSNAFTAATLSVRSPVLSRSESGLNGAQTQPSSDHVDNKKCFTSSEGSDVCLVVAAFDAYYILIGQVRCVLSIEHVVFESHPSLYGHETCITVSLMPSAYIELSHSGYGAGPTW
jgi:hypothetical protein